MVLPPASAAFASLLLAATQPADVTGAPAPAWRGQMQCGATWTDPADETREWTMSVGSDTSNIRLNIAGPALRGDPRPLGANETRELAPRKAKLEIPGVGGGEVEVTSVPAEAGRIWHDIALGHVEKLDDFPDRLALVLTIEGAAPLRIDMTGFAAARTYLKRCLDR